MIRSKKGVIMQYIAFIVVGLVIVLITAFIAPISTDFSTKMYVAGEQIITNAQPELDKISDASVRTNLNQSFESAKASTETNILVSTSAFAYAWIIFLVIAVLYLIVVTRKLAEYGGIV